MKVYQYHRYNNTCTVQHSICHPSLTSNPLKPNGYYTYHWFMCVAWISGQTANFTIQFLQPRQCVFPVCYEVYVLSIIQVKFSLQKIHIPLVSKADYSQHAEKMKCPLQLSAKNIQRNGLPFTPPTFCTVHWALKSGSKNLSQNVSIPLLNSLCSMHIQICYARVCARARAHVSLSLSLSS